MRSLLFVPGDSERKLEKSLSSLADVLILDLEDSVSVERKPVAREVAARFLSGRVSSAEQKFYVRINALTTDLALGDLDAVLPGRPDGILLPKAEHMADVKALAEMLDRHESEHGIPAGTVKIIALVTETARGMLSYASYDKGHERLAGLTWGAEDLSADIGAQAARDDTGRMTDVFRFARTITLVAATAAGTAAIDTVFVDFRDDDGLRGECREAARDGFTAKLAIHPAQVEIINEAFTPSKEMIEEAEAVFRAFADAGNPGVVAIDGKMFDRPHLIRAMRLLERARSIK